VAAEWVAFIDDSMDDNEAAWSGAVLIRKAEQQRVAAELESTVQQRPSPRGGPLCEVKGSDLFAGKGAFSGARAPDLSVARDWLAILDGAGARCAFRGVQSSEFVRYRNARERARISYDVAFGHLLHTVARITMHEPVEVVHDSKPGTEDALRRTFERAVATGVMKHRREPCRGLKSLRFAESHASRLIQAADLSTSIWRRRWRDSHPGVNDSWFAASEERQGIESALKSLTRFSYCWQPRSGARKQSCP
jgi:hypothetical protein